MAVTDPPAPTGMEPSGAFGRRRDRLVLALLRSHPATAAMLVSLGWFPNKDKALRRLRRLVARKHLRVVGTACRDVGRPEHVYCGWQPRLPDLLHEVQLTELFLRLSAGRILRGPQVHDRARRPDAEVWIDGRCHLLELDRGTAGYAQVERRFRLYEDCAHLSLWVCLTEARREGLRRRAGRLRHSALFATLAEVLAAPHGPVWVDHDGGRAALPRELGAAGPQSCPGAEKGGI